MDFSTFKNPANLRKYSIWAAFFLLGYVLGVYTLKNQWFPAAQLVQLKHYLFPHTINPSEHIKNPYLAGIPLFSDRPYPDRIGDKRLDSLILVQVPRHFRFPIEMELYKKTKIYRLLSETNDNSAFEDWTKTDIEVNVIGASCSHTAVVYKVFEPGKLSLVPGGPLAASPILIENPSKTETDLPFKIIN